MAGQRHHLCILLGELPPFHREVLTRFALHLGRLVRRQRLNGASWRGLALMVAPLVFGKGCASSADDAMRATVACERLLRTVNAAASPVSPSPSPREVSPVATPVAPRPEPPATPPTSPEPVATPPTKPKPAPIATPRSIAIATPPRPAPEPIATKLPLEPVPTPATVTPSRGERTCLVVRSLVAQRANELSVKEGDVVLVPAADLAKFGSFVYARKTDGSDREGYVPHKFVREGSRR